MATLLLPPALGILLLLGTVAAAESPPLDVQLPAWAQARWRTVAKERSLALSRRINPFLQRGDFDGDGKPDLALLVENVTGKVGVVVLHRARSDARARRRDRARQRRRRLRVDGRRSVQAETTSRRREALRLEKEGSGGGLVSFEGGRYRWTQHGD